MNPLFADRIGIAVAEIEKIARVVEPEPWSMANWCFPDSPQV